MIKTFEAIQAAIIANNGMVIDDHRSGREPAEQLRKVHGIAKYAKDTVYLCSADETPYFCLNGMYVDEEGKPHLSRWSVGGVIETRNHGGLMEGIRAYNDPKNWIPGFTITEVRAVVLF
jgi:hypothetical protein